MLPTRPLGRTGLEVSILGLGGGPLGDPSLPERDAASLLDRALERGVTLFDAARSYGDCEARLGRLLEGRRDAVTLSTKVGYGVEGHDDWTGPCVAAGIDRALRALRTDRIDVAHLHSCPAAVATRDDILDALRRALDAGKIRVAAYAGEEADLDAAVATGAFGSVQLSVSPWDQRSLRARVPALRARGVGVLAKRPLANAAWRPLPDDAGPDRREYGRRHEALGLPPARPWPELAIRFAAFAPGVDAALLGTSKREHLDHALDAVARGPLPADETDALAARFDAVGADWPGIV